jgi:hypothetical protein
MLLKLVNKKTNEVSPSLDMKCSLWVNLKLLSKNGAYLYAKSRANKMQTLEDIFAKVNIVMNTMTTL